MLAACNQVRRGGGALYFRQTMSGSAVARVHGSVDKGGGQGVGAAGARLPTPYLDVFGEEDEYLRRGKPLSLCEARHQRLLWLWVTHKLREEIARAGQNRPDNNWSIF